MVLSKRKIAAIAVASTVAAGGVVATVAGGIVGKAAYGTVHVIDAARATKKFKSFEQENENNPSLQNCVAFKIVKKFVHNPRGAKLVAVPILRDGDSDRNRWSFEYYGKDQWKAIQKNKKEEWKNKGCKFDFDAVLLFLEYAEKAEPRSVTKFMKDVEQAKNSMRMLGKMFDSQKMESLVDRVDNVTCLLESLDLTDTKTLAEYANKAKIVSEMLENKEAISKVAKKFGIDAEKVKNVLNFIKRSSNE